MNFYPIYKNKKLLPWIKWWILKGNKVMPKHLSEWINSASAISLTGVYKGSPLLNLTLKGNTSQTGTPSPEAPVPVNVVKGNNTITINDTDYQVNLQDYELCKIGDYQDVIYKQNNKWYVDKYIGKHEIASSDITLISTYWYSTYGVYGAGISKDILNIEKTITDKQSLCNISSKVNAIANISNAKYIFTANANYVFFFSNTSDTLDKAKAELTGGIIYYNLDTSETTEITETNLINQLEAIYNCKLNSGTNTITQTPSDLPFYLNFRYYEKG